MLSTAVVVRVVVGAQATVVVLVVLRVVQKSSRRQFQRSLPVLGVVVGQAVAAGVQGSVMMKLIQDILSHFIFAT